MEDKTIKPKAEFIPKTNLRHYLLRESFAMVKHLSAEGKTIPLSASPILGVSKEDCCKVDMDNKDIIKLHDELSKKIAPAHPKTVWLLYQEAHIKRGLSFLGPVKLIRRFMLVALLSLLGFLWISTSEIICFENISRSIYELHGAPLMVILGFLLCSASLGASFSTLFQANDFIRNNTYDPKYESSYWIRYVLGIMSGIILATVIPISDDITNSASAQAHLAVSSKPLLALLGGFSSALVYRILFRLVYAVESIFVGKQNDQSEEKISQLQSANELEKGNEKQKYVNQLLSLQGQINQGKSTSEINDEIQKKITEIND